jgi:hypothetical protein
VEHLESKENQSPETEQETRTDVPEPEGMLLGDLLSEPPSDETTEPPPSIPPEDEEMQPDDPPCPCPCPCPCGEE